ncbi:JDVT-CTERM system glutamic-type intramembrane protease MrtJ [Tamilnaduibacter salinus]|uniref:JDVT-CTERM system glutamic-type intramembrane protease MrtJ n=1 Tax=Tamilnaduibacter salinus TaxID=1484056 RepID=UPI001403F318|nr:JDVT-CTERM system glutamic-type intramembrane protease [Tamilnaduibacter salinus]
MVAPVFLLAGLATGILSDRPSFDFDGEPLVWFLIVYPVCEEVVFRGVIQRSLLGWAPMRRGMAGVSIANLLTSLLFTGIHFWSHDVLLALLVFLPSLIFGYCYEMTRWLTIAIGLHVWYNLIALFWVWP